jgi:hypothetical protein
MLMVLVFSGAALANEPRSEKAPQVPKASDQLLSGAPRAAAVPADDAAVVKRKLTTLGLTEREAADRVAALTPADLEKLRQNPEQLQNAGIKDKTLIIIAVILIVPSILLLLIV